MKDLDLEPHEYGEVAPGESRGISSNGEPFFGPGWPFAVAVLISIFIAAFLHDASGPVYVIGAVIGAAIGGIIQQVYR